MANAIERLERAVEQTCRRLHEPAQADVIDAALRDQAASFDAMTANIADGVVPPIDALVALRRRLTDADATLPVSRLFPTKYVPGARRERTWSDLVIDVGRRLDELRFQAVASRNTHACDCLVLVELSTNGRMPISTQLRHIGIEHDDYNGGAYQCGNCGTRWLNCAEDTESQHIEWWESRAVTWEPEAARLTEKP